MALHVTYTNRIGYFTLKSRDSEHTWKLWFCHANAMCAMMYFWRETKENKRRDMVKLWGFFQDAKHAEACIKDGFFRDCTGFTFIAKEMGENSWKLVKILTKYGIKVTIK